MADSKVIARLLEAMEEGNAPWERPWEAAPPKLQMNAATGKPYRGGNQILLSMLAPTGDNRWCTFNQAKANGWKVKKGSSGVPVEFYTIYDYKRVVEKDENGEEHIKRKVVEREYPVMKQYTVFHASQLEGIPEINTDSPGYVWDKHEEVEKIIAESGATVFHDQDSKAFYRISEDAIHMPTEDRFESPEGYYSTLLHEMGHWTGHESRLSRNLAGTFGSPDYALEELRAEISSYFLSLSLGLPVLEEHVQNHAAYMRGWKNRVKDPKKELASAIRDAEKISNYILSLRDRNIEHEEIEEECMAR